MADIEHATLTGVDLHEPKGVSGATPGQAYVSDGVSSGAWMDISVLGGSIGTQLATFGAHTTSQGPVATDTDYQILFGAGGTGNGDIILDGSGNFTVVNDGEYQFYMNLNYGRSTSSGTAQVNVRIVINGTQLGGSGNTWLGTSDERLTKVSAFTLGLSAADILTVELQRDSAGSNDGGLFIDTPTDITWNPVPSASIAIYRHVTV